LQILLDDDDIVVGDCLVVDCRDLSVKCYSLGFAPYCPVIDISWSLDASRLVTVNTAVRIDPVFILSRAGPSTRLITVLYYARGNTS